ncbi:putative Ig domain-containing protein, partial [Larkinella ripae]
GSVPGLGFNSGNRVLSGTPIQAGSYPLTYSASDGKATASTSVVVTVASPASTNKPPVPPSISPLTATVGQGFSTTLPVFTDPENGALTYAVVNRPGWLNFNTGNRVLNGTPTASGTHTLTYSATDNKGAKTNLSVTLTVNPAPSVTGNFEGFLDQVSCSGFTGWVWNRDQPNAAVTIEFLDGGTLATARVVGTTSANQFRQDLLDAGKGNGAHGYSFAVPQSLKDNQTRTIWARVQYNAYVLMWSPKPLNCAPNQRLAAAGFPDSELPLELSLTPNPTTGLVKVRFQVAEKQEAELNVTDLLGRTLHQRTLLGTGQPQEETVDLGQNANGVYFIHLKTDQKNRSGRVLLHR